MITQGSNLPLYFSNIPISLDSIADVSAGIYTQKDGKELKHWGKDDLTITENGILAPISQSESMGLPVGFCYVELKFTDNSGMILPGIRVMDHVSRRDDKTELSGEQPQTLRYVDIDCSDVLTDVGAVVGASAYEVAVRNGFQGTEKEWLDSLVGGNGGSGIESLADWVKQPNPPTYTAEDVGADASGTADKIVKAHNESDTAHPAISQKIAKLAAEVGKKEASGTAESKVSAHNTAADAHNDIRLLVQGLTERLNALADSDDETLDQMSEVVAYIKSNKSLIDAITTSKVSVSDIIDNLTTNVSNKPLSAAQGVKLKALIDAIVVPTKLSELENDSGYIMSPDKAIVGQVLMVKSVDTNGKPTGFETTDKGDVIDVDAELKAYMMTVKPDMVSAIVEKGGTASETDAWGDFPKAVRAIPNGISATETLPEQTALTAAILAAGGVGLTWKDTGASGYLILKKTGDAPQNTSDGALVYRGEWSADVVDADVSEGITYYYRIFPYNSANQYQAAEGESIKMITYKNRSGQLRVSDMSLGDKILFGQWGTAVQSWTVCDTQDKESGFVTVCLDGIASGSNRYFDTPETNNPNSTRASQGNNRWAYSNVRQWLNSDGEASSWFVAQHDYDVQPNYYNIKGWLADFTDYEKEILVLHKSKCILDTNDGGGSETVYDKMFLATSYAVGLEVAYPLEDEHTYELFDSNANRSFAANWWLRTVNNAAGTPSTASGVRDVRSNGALDGITANGYNIAVRPFCCLPTSAYIAWSDSDSAYVFADDSQRNG